MMAEIKGITLKNITNFKGHEGEPCKQGNICYSGKKVGYYSDSFMMGPPEIEFDSDEKREIIVHICDEFYKQFPDKLKSSYSDLILDPDLELFFYELIKLIDHEKEYKRFVKKGFPILLTYEQKNGIEKMIGCSTQDVADETIAELIDIINLKQYKSLDDFLIK